MDANDEQLIQDTYRKKGYPGINKLYQILKNNGESFTHKQIKSVVNKQKSYQLHKKQSNKKITSHMVAFYPDMIWLVDLLDMSKFATSNNGYKWILLGIDVFTRRGFAEPMKNKEAGTVLDSFKQFIKFEGIPEKLLTDNGSEFINKNFQSELKRHKIIHETNDPGYHPALGVIDRLSRTIKDKIFRLFTDKDTTKWVKQLTAIIEGYNHTPHPSIGNIEPIHAEQHEEKIKKINLDKNIDPKHKYQIGMLVRWRLKKGIFKKGYTQIWSTETSHIKSIKGVNATLTNGKQFKLNDLQEIIEVPTNLIEGKTQKIDKIEKQAKIKRDIRKEGLDDNINTVVEPGVKRMRVPTFRIDSDQSKKRKTKKDDEYTYYGAPDLTEDEIAKILAKERSR